MSPVPVRGRGRPGRGQAGVTLPTGGRTPPAAGIDAEDGHTRLGLAAELAEAMGARYLTLPQLSAASVRQLAGD